MESDKACIFLQFHWPHKYHINVVVSVRCSPELHVSWHVQKSTWTSWFIMCLLAKAQIVRTNCKNMVVISRPLKLITSVSTRIDRPVQRSDTCH